MSSPWNSAANEERDMQRMSPGYGICWFSWMLKGRELVHGSVQSSLALRAD